MSKRDELRLDRAGLAKVLASPKVAKATRRVAEDVAAGANGVQAHDGPVPVRVQQYEAKGGRLRSPRPGFAVMLDHPGGLGLEAKYAPLVKAATAKGLEVKKRKAR